MVQYVSIVPVHLHMHSDKPCTRLPLRAVVHLEFKTSIANLISFGTLMENTESSVIHKLTSPAFKSFVPQGNITCV